MLGPDDPRHPRDTRGHHHLQSPPIGRAVEMDEVRAMDHELAEAASPPPLVPSGAWPPGLIEVENVVFRHPGADPERKAHLAEVNLTIEPGEFLGLTGESGAGKTTLADLLCGLLMPQSGRIVIAGVACPKSFCNRGRGRPAWIA